MFWVSSERGNKVKDRPGLIAAKMAYHSVCYNTKFAIKIRTTRRNKKLTSLRGV